MKWDSVMIRASKEYMIDDIIKEVYKLSIQGIQDWNKKPCERHSSRRLEYWVNQKICKYYYHQG